MVDPRLVQELYDTDPEFVVFAKNVLDVNTPEQFVSTVTYAKMQPDSSAVHVPGGNGGVKKLRRRPVSKSVGQNSNNQNPKQPGRVRRAASKVRRATGGPYVIRSPKRPIVQSAGQTRRFSAGVAGLAGGLGMAGYMAYRNASKQEHVDKSIDGECSEFTKVDSDKRQVFGWASITHVNGQPVIDRQGDTITLDEVEKSAYEYVVKSRVGGSQHKREGDQPFHAADLIESFVVTEDKAKAMGLGDDVPQGWWVGFKVNDEDTWAKVKNGDVTGFSVHGRGKRQQIDGELTPSEVVDA